jgi:RNA polymerase sigma factor (sigma-70 family)
LDPESSRNFVSAVERKRGRALRRYLAVRMRNADADVSDLVQEVFLRLLRVPDHEAIRKPEAYLYTIASHVLHQYRLRQSADAEPLDPLDLDADLAASVEYDPAERALLEQRFEAAGRAVQRRSPRAYAVLIMYRCEGATLHQIGERLGVSHTMARKYLINAMLYCQQALADLE